MLPSHKWEGAGSIPAWSTKAEMAEWLRQCFAKAFHIGSNPILRSIIGPLVEVEDTGDLKSLHEGAYQFESDTGHHYGLVAQSG